MRFLSIFMLAAALFVFNGCASRNAETGSTDSGASRSEAPAAPATAPQNDSSTGTAKQSTVTDGEMKQVSLSNAQTQANVTVTERKIIRNANLTIETNDPADGQRRISSIAESRGGFVVTSESKQRNREGQLKPDMVVTITIRVPAAQFDSVMSEIRGTGSRVAQEKTTGQDVTEEYIDLEARLRAKQALEAQFMEIMKQAKSVQDALEVQRQISEVRSEIERLEGRRRFLENQSSLSTISVTLEPPTQLVSSTGFLYSVKRAFMSGLDVAAAITLALVQLVVALLPIALFIFLPVFLVVRYLVRRAQRRARLAPSVVPPPPTTATPTS